MSAQTIDFQADPREHRESGFVPQPTSPDAAAARAATNRANAQHSTGPRTAEGKAASSQNALKHGLSLQCHAVLEHEDPAAYDQLCHELRAIFAPESPREHLALGDISHCRWALRRFDEAEATLLEFHYARGADPANDQHSPISYGEALGYTCIQEPGEPKCPEYPSLLLLNRYRSHWDRRYQRALAEFDRAQRTHRQGLRDAQRQQESLRKAAHQASKEAASERRREELHQLRVALAEAKLVRERQRTAKSHQVSKEQELDKIIADYLQSPPDGITEEQLAAHGFVSSAPFEPAAADEIGSQTMTAKATS